MIKGYYNNTLFNNLGNQNFNNINFDNEKTITMKRCGDGNYQALIRDFDEPDDNEEIEVVQLKNINIDSDNVNDLLKESKVNQFFFGGLTVIGLYVVFQLIRKTK